MHTSLAWLSKHIVPKGLKHKDPELTFQLALSTFCSLQLRALINSSALSSHSSQLDTFSIALFSSVCFVPCKCAKTPCSCFFCTNWFSLIHCLESGEGGVEESQPLSHLRSSTFPLSKCTFRARNKTTSGGCFTAWLRIILRLLCGMTLLLQR